MNMTRYAQKSPVHSGKSKSVFSPLHDLRALLVFSGFTLFYLLGFIYAPYAKAGTAEEISGVKDISVEEILKRSEQNVRGFKDLVNELEMVVTTPDGQSISRKMMIKVLAENDQSVKSLMVFTAPKRERGVALLTHSSTSSVDEQWLYLPSTRRIKKMSSGHKTSSFRGTDFSFEDLSNQAASDYRYKLVGKQNNQGGECYVMDRFPKLDSGYQKVRIWIDTKYYRPLKSEFYDENNTLLKVMTTEDYQKIDGQFWQPARIRMENQLSGQVTELISRKITINSGLTANHFTEMSLRRFR